MLTEDQQRIKDLAVSIKEKGFRVFIAERGTYGFFTNTEGTRVVCFGIELSGFSFSGNYRTSNMLRTGSGWRIDTGFHFDFQEIFNAVPPLWATQGETWSYTALERKLKDYQSTSRYEEL